MPRAYVLIQREERKSAELLLWTTQLSDHADFCIILAFISVSMDLVFCFVKFAFKFRDWKENMAPESPTQGGALSQGAKSTREIVILPIAFFFEKGHGCPLERELLLAAVPDNDKMYQSPDFGIRLPPSQYPPRQSPAPAHFAKNQWHSPPSSHRALQQPAKGLHRAAADGSRRNMARTTGQ